MTINLNQVEIPEFCLVLLVGSAGAGKSHFARRFFSKTEIVSSDHCRAMVSDDENDQSVSAEAFELLHHLVQLRLKKRRLTVVDATNLVQSERQTLRLMAKQYHAYPISIVIDPGLDVCLQQNKNRLERVVDEGVIREHDIALRKSLKQLPDEAFREIYHFGSPEKIRNATLCRIPLRVDQRHETGNFDIIGDIHGCFDELVLLLERMGYQFPESGDSTLSTEEKSYHVIPPPGRRAIFLGDLVDRGPKTPEVLQLVKSMVDNGTALCIEGNHEAKLLRWMRGQKTSPKYGLAESIGQLEARNESFRTEMMGFIRGLPSHLWLDGGKLLVAHAGLKQEMHGRMSGKEKSFCLYGDTTGQKDEFGWPIRLNWGADYSGEAMVVYGHTPVAMPEWQNNTLCIDTGCVFGGKLTALRYPEKELVSIAALQTYTEPKKPLGSILDEGEGS